MSYATTAGEDPPVVLLHGAGFDSAAISWKYALPALSGRRAIALDWPGYGESDRPRRRYTTDYYVEVLTAFLDALGVGRATLAGISMGGGVALGFAVAAPERVEELVLVDSYGLGASASWLPAASLVVRNPLANGLMWASLRTNRQSVRWALSQIMLPGNVSTDIVEDVYASLQSPQASRAASSWHRAEFGPGGFHSDFSDRLGRLSMPVLLLHGADDTLLPASWARAAADELSNARLHLFETCGHWPPRERPRAFNHAVSAFLGGETVA